MKLTRQSDFSTQDLKIFRENLKNYEKICEYYMLISAGKTKLQAMRSVNRSAGWSRATFFRRLSEFERDCVGK